jgi:hypothetical protein
MSSQHRDPPLNVRPDTATRLAAAKILDAHGKDMTGFIDACLAMLVASPDAMLRSLGQVWRKTPKPKGRPPKPEAKR